jgi:hypothetical protein
MVVYVVDVLVVTFVMVESGILRYEEQKQAALLERKALT